MPIRLGHFIVLAFQEYFVKSKNDPEKSIKMYYYMLTLGKDSNGKRIQVKKRGFETEKKAKEALRKVQVAADTGTYIKPSKASYGEYINEWFDTRKGTLARLTAKNGASNIKNHILPLIGHIQLADLNAMHIEKFISQLRGKGLAEATAKKIFTLVSSSLISASKKDIILKNVASFADNKPKPKQKQVEVWDEHEVRFFLEYVHETKNRYYIALLLALMTGMRQGEILGLRWRDVDLNRKMISVRQSLSHDGKEFGPPKTQCSIRSIGIDDGTIEMLKQHKKLITKDKWHAKELYTDNDLVVCTTVGTPYKPRMLDKFWNN